MSFPGTAPPAFVDLLPTAMAHPRAETVHLNLEVHRMVVLGGRPGSTLTGDSPRANALVHWAAPS
jgi:hypothetical protein